MSNKDRLINEVYDEAKKCYNKGIAVSKEELLSAITETIGDSVIGDHETLISGNVEVSEEVKVQGDSMLCRKLNVAFTTRQFRISSSNWLVPVSDFYKADKSYSGPIHQYTGPLEDQQALNILIGEKEDYVRENIVFGYASYNVKVVSIEKQDVFVVTRQYTPGKPVEKSVQSPDCHYTGSYNKPTFFYESDAQKVPKTLHENTHWYFPAQKTSSWFGLKTHKKPLPGSNPIVGITRILPQKRDTYKYSVNFYINELVSEFIDGSSVAFNPLHLERLVSC
jgi:hypothetical protein